MGEPGRSMKAKGVRSRAPDPVLDWLLEKVEPSVRYRTLTQVLRRPATDPEVIEARERIGRSGWAADILRDRRPGGWWHEGKSLYWPKYLSTNWKLLVLADLGVTRSTPGIEESCELWMSRLGSKDGSFGGSPKSKGHLCIAGNTARALIQFGYEDDPRVRSALEWLVSAADPKGGWSCYGSGRNLDSWEALSAFAVYPREKWTTAMHTVVERGAEFFLQRELHVQGGEYLPWNRFHYPVHYYYDLLVGLDLLTALGYASDRRLEFALTTLRERRRPDGRWNLDALHPDVEGGVAEWIAQHPKDRPTPWGVETPGQPSKMITLRARVVLARMGGPLHGTPNRVPSSKPRTETARDVRSGPQASKGRTRSESRRKRSSSTPEVPVPPEFPGRPSRSREDRTSGVGSGRPPTSASRPPPRPERRPGGSA
ncbi:MAG: terpene cyclase/mutase family protein [Thermoplasmata archaeon]|nr:terpene cyclase/mutase family protein [Thermoplasmata archaeon]